MKEYCNLHAHSTSSLLDGMSKYDEYAARAQELGMKGICFTEHGNLHGLLDAYEAAKNAGLKYHPGIEFYQARKTRFDRDPEEQAGKESAEWAQRGPYHLGVIAYNNAGYHNLIKLSSKAFLEGFFVKPRIDHELLAQHSEGLVALSGCLSGEVQQALLRDDFDFALNAAAKMRDIVGHGNYFIEVQDHGIEEERRNYPKLLEIAKLLDVPIVATCDSHYTHKEHHTHHDILLCINTGARIDTPNRFQFSGPHFYLKSYEEMAQLFPEEYLKNTLLVLEKNEIDLQFNEHHIPLYPTPDGQDVDSYFVQWVYKGAEERFGPNWRTDKQIVERLEYEMGVIREMEFPNYFLIVADIVEWARQNGIMAGPGRGSAAGSLVSYCMKITEVNPLQYGLPFERFLIPGRKSLPDIDLDFDDRYRDAVIQYTRNKYGFDHTAQIGTVSEVGAKTAIRDVARVLNHPYQVGDEINKAMPPALFGKSKTLDECLKSDEFLKLYESNETAKEIIDIARVFEGQWRQTGMHAAGLVVADKPLIEYVPVLRKGEDKPIITQWDMAKIDKIGLLKIDFLGLRNISMEMIAIDNVAKTRGIEIKDPYKLIDEADPEVYNALGNGDNVGVFQLESDGLLNLMVGMKPSNIEDIAALLALYRPGPMGSNFHNEYVERKHGRKPVKYLHPCLKPYLENTYGLLIYQEQVLSIARFVAGFSVPDSDALRKAMGKKIPAEMKKWRSQFVDGCIKTSNMPHAIAEQLFDEIQHHADYSFSKNHAVSYAFTSYLTAYLKTKYPTEFLAAAMTSLGSKTTNKDRLRLYLNECRKKGIKVLPPSIQSRNAYFEVLNDNEVIYGFESVKGFGEKSVELMQKDTKEYVNLFQFLRDADNNYLDRGTVSSLIDAGCLDDFFSQMEIYQDALTRQQKMSILYRELNTLGVFLSDHPFNNVADLIAGKATHTLSQLQQMGAAEKVKVAGIVIDVEKKITRAGKKMYNIYLEDDVADTVVTIMPQIAANLPEDPYKTGDILIVTGKTKREGDDENTTISILMYEAEKVDDTALVGGNPIFISTKNQLTFSQVKRINDIIENNKGNSPVFLTFYDGHNEVKIKFNSLTSKDIEPTLKLLLEV